MLRRIVVFVMAHFEDLAEIDGVSFQVGLRIHWKGPYIEDIRIYQNLSASCWTFPEKGSFNSSQEISQCSNVAESMDANNVLPVDPMIVDLCWLVHLICRNHSIPSLQCGGVASSSQVSSYGGFLSHRGTPSHHPSSWDFWIVNHPAIGDSPCMEPPIQFGLATIFSVFGRDAVATFGGRVIQVCPSARKGRGWLVFELFGSEMGCLKG